MENQNWDEAGAISNLKIDEKWCKMYLVLESVPCVPWEMRGDEAYPFHCPVNWGEAGGHRSKLKVVLA